MLLLVSRLELVDSERAIVKIVSRSLSPKKLFCCFVIINNKNIDINKYLFQHILHSDIRERSDNLSEDEIKFLQKRFNRAIVV